MKRHKVLILSNLDTAELLEIGIGLISDMETEGTLLRWRKMGCLQTRHSVSSRAICLLWEGDLLGLSCRDGEEITRCYIK